MPLPQAMDVNRETTAITLRPDRGPLLCLIASHFLAFVFSSVPLRDFYHLLIIYTENNTCRFRITAWSDRCFSFLKYPQNVCKHKKESSVVFHCVQLCRSSVTTCFSQCT